MWFTEDADSGEMVLQVWRKKRKAEYEILAMAPTLR
jgi:hypothetical protein